MTAAQGWDFTATPRLVRLDPAVRGHRPTQTVTTDENGYAQFNGNPPSRRPRRRRSAAVGWVPGRPRCPNDDFRCEAKDETGSTQEITGKLTVSGGTASFELDPIGNEIVTCTVYNSYDYDPAIEITKVNDPAVIRGDLNPACAQVTSTYEVSNPGNTPLSQVGVTDDRCGRSPGAGHRPEPGRHQQERSARPADPGRSLGRVLDVHLHPVAERRRRRNRKVIQHHRPRRRPDR